MWPRSSFIAFPHCSSATVRAPGNRLEMRAVPVTGHQGSLCRVPFAEFCCNCSWVRPQSCPGCCHSWELWIRSSSAQVWEGTDSHSAEEWEHDSSCTSSSRNRAWKRTKNLQKYLNSPDLVGTSSCWFLQGGEQSLECRRWDLILLQDLNPSSSQSSTSFGSKGLMQQGQSCCD